MVALRLTLLGGFDARLGAGAAVSLPTKKAQALLAYLGVRPGQTHQRDKLAALLWGERSDEHARDGLRHALVALRKALRVVTPPALLVEGQTLALNAAVVNVDVATFQRRVAAGTPRALEQAAGLYRGDLLLGFAVNEPLFEEWLIAERERLREIALEALARLLAHQTKAGGTEPAIQTAIRLLGLDPLQEAVHRTLMRLYARQGRRGAALKQYQTCVAMLQRELGAEPEAATKQLYQELLRRRPLGLSRASDPTSPHLSHDAGQGRLGLPNGETPLIGRARELALVGEALNEAGKEHGKLIALVGEAGIGKTSLLGAVAADAAARGARVLTGLCYGSASILPFGPWVDALRSGPVLDEQRLAALGPVWQSELARLLPELARPGLPAPSDNPLRLFESVAHLIEQLAAGELLVLVFEDVHWADEMSLRLLAFIARRIHRWRALLLTTAREEDLADASAARRILAEVGRDPHTVTLSLAPLSRSDVALLAGSLSRVGCDADELAHLEEQVWRVSEGNPFVAVETIRAIQAGSIITRPPTLPIAERVRELIVERLEALSERARELACVAAVIGRDVDFRLLMRASGLEEISVAEAAEELVRRHVLHHVADRFAFTHDRVREVAYSRLLRPRKALLHRAVAEALEATSACVQEPHYFALGTHFREGEVWDKAVTYLRAAAASATARSAYRDAATCLAQALEMARRL